MAQELRITLKATIPVEDGDAFALAEQVADTKAKLKELTDHIVGAGGEAIITSKLVSPRKRDDAAEDQGEPAPTGAEPGEG